MSVKDKASRRELIKDALADYESGPDAPIRATARALAKVGGARAIILVEGISDQIALETFATRCSRELDAKGILIFPIGGAQAIARYLSQFGPQGMGLMLAGLCDAAEEGVFRRGLEKAGLGSPQTRADMEHLGFFVCVDDLESELIRAVRPDRVEALFDAQGDLGSFRTLQKQAAWRGQSVEAQMHRFLRSNGRRNLRYAHLLVNAVELERVPHPLDAVLAHI